MQIGIHLAFQNLRGIPDNEFHLGEAKLAIEAEAMGFDIIGAVEHHFTD